MLTSVRGYIPNSKRINSACSQLLQITEAMTNKLQIKNVIWRCPQATKTWVVYINPCTNKIGPAISMFKPCFSNLKSAYPFSACSLWSKKKKKNPQTCREFFILSFYLFYFILFYFIFKNEYFIQNKKSIKTANAQLVHKHKASWGSYTSWAL